MTEVNIEMETSLNSFISIVLLFSWCKIYHTIYVIDSPVPTLYSEKSCTYSSTFFFLLLYTNCLVILPDQIIGQIVSGLLYWNKHDKPILQFVLQTVRLVIKLSNYKTGVSRASDINLG